MRTASFQTYQGPGRISIARFAPRGTPAGFKTYKKLAPGSWFNSVSRHEYEKRFRTEILAPLDARAVHDELHALAQGAEPHLLCWEVPPFTLHNWCHRRLVADWFAEKLGIQVPELIVSR